MKDSQDWLDIKPYKKKEYIERLERRANWLRSQVESTPDRTDISHTRSELSALDWAIAELRNKFNDKYKED